MIAGDTADLGAVVEFSNGANFTKADFGDGLKIIGVGDFGDRVSPDWTALSEVNESAVTSPKQLVRMGDILFVRSNGNRLLVGRNLFVDRDVEATHSAFTIRARPDSSRVDSRFLAYQLRHLHRSGAMGGASGTNITNLNQTILRGIQVWLPSLSEQSRVAGALSSIDDLIENNQRRVAVLEEIARSTYQEWFVAFRFPGHEHVTFVDSDLGKIPEGWRVSELGSIAAADRSTVHPKNDPETWFDHYSIPAFDDGQLPVVEVGESIRSGKYEIREPAVMVSKLNTRIPRTWFVEPAGSNPAVASTEFVILRPQGDRSLEWVYGTVTSRAFQDRLTQLSGGTSGSHQRLRPAEMLAIPVIDPAIEMIIRANDVLQPSLTLARRLRRQTDGLSSLRDLLLPKLVTGQIGISDLDLDAVVEKAGA